MSWQVVEEISLMPACDPSEQPTGECTIRFAEGFVSYNGNTTNSTAIYTLVDAYCINGSGVRVCEAGYWLDFVTIDEGELMGSWRMNEMRGRKENVCNEGACKSDKRIRCLCVL